MDKKIEKILKIWHGHFSDKNHRYSGFENSDIEYFLGCMLYNHFAFSHALDTMKTIDLSYDFLVECDEDMYDEINDIIATVSFEEEIQKIEYLQNYIEKARSKYDDDELYLLDRLQYHVEGIAKRYKNNIKAQKVDFEALKK